MASEPFDINLVIERIKQQVTEFKLVEGAADYAAITALRDFRPPCCYVLLAQEKGGDDSKGSAQQALVTFGVVVVVKNYRDVRKGAEAADALRPLVGKVRDALKNWIPDEQGARKCRWLQGDVADYDQQNLLWIDVFKTQHILN